MERYRITETVDIDSYFSITLYLSYRIQNKLNIPVEILEEVVNPINMSTRVAFKIKNKVFEFTLYTFAGCEPFDLDKAIMQIKDTITD